MPFEEIFFLAAIVVLSVCCMVLAIVLRQQMRRYEQFRGEVAFVFAECFRQLTDHDTRLIGAGHPPGRVVPMALPDWFAKPHTPP